MREQQEEQGYITGQVTVSLSTLMSVDFEGCLDIFSDELTGTEALMDVMYKPVSVAGEYIVIEVVGDASAILETEDEPTL